MKRPFSPSAIASVIALSLAGCTSALKIASKRNAARSSVAVPQSVPLSVSRLEEGHASLSWEAIAGAVTYEVSRWEVSDPTLMTTLSRSGDTSFVDTTLPRHGTFVYRIKAFGPGDSLLATIGPSDELVLPNHPPVLADVKPVIARDMVPLAFKIAAVDPDGDTVHVSCVAGCPQGIAVTDDGAVTWTPGVADLGDHRVTFAAQDDFGGSASLEVTITVTSRFTTGMAAFRVLGQADFVSCAADRGGSVSRDGLNIPEGVAAAGGKIWVADRGNNRILGWDAMPTANDTPPDRVWGQPDFTTNASGVSSTKLAFPRNVATNGKEWVIGDDQNFRVLIFNAPPLSPSTPADYVLGQPDFDTRLVNGGNNNDPAANTLRDHYMISVFVHEGMIVVSDRGNGRVLVFRKPYATHMNANLVIGKPNFTTTYDPFGTPPAASATEIGFPGQAWTDGKRLLIADPPNNRVLLWNTFPTTNGAPADVVLGQTDMTSSAANRGGAASAATMSLPVSIASDGTRIFVGDVDNHRILVFNRFPQTNGVAADAIIGQADESGTTGQCSQTGFHTPAALAWDGQNLIVADQGSGNRILFFGK